uniref:SHD domain-containing protein n=1 Tax=Oncorhynchus tshawytscha TaxID=74940 RepID=A0A8C8IA75_ONCTS
MNNPNWVTFEDECAISTSPFFASTPLKIPGSGTKLASTPLKIPGSGTKLVSTPLKIPGSGTKLASTPLQIPGSGTKLASTPLKIPGSGTKLASTPLKIPGSGTKLASTPLKIPGSGTKLASTPLKIPGSGTKLASTPLKIPGSGTKLASTPLKIPGSGTKLASTPLKIPGSGTKLASTPLKIPGSGTNSASATMHSSSPPGLDQATHTGTTPHPQSDVSVSDGPGPFPSFQGDPGHFNPFWERAGGHSMDSGNSKDPPRPDHLQNSYFYICHKLEGLQAEEDNDTEEGLGMDRGGGEERDTGCSRCTMRKDWRSPSKSFSCSLTALFSDLKLESNGEPRNIQTVKVEDVSYTEKKRYHHKLEVSHEAEVEQLLKFGTTEYGDMEDLLETMEEILRLTPPLSQKRHYEEQRPRAPLLRRQLRSRLLKFSPPDACRVELMRYKTVSAVESQPVMQVTVGTVKYEDVYSVMVWRIDRLHAKNMAWLENTISLFPLTAVENPHTFSCKLELGSDQEIPTDWYPFVTMECEMVGAVVSQTRVTSLGTDSDVQPQKHVTGTGPTIIVEIEKKWIETEAHRQSGCTPQ